MKKRNVYPFSWSSGSIFVALLKSVELVWEECIASCNESSAKLWDISN
jgi:hypothetical protein